MSERLTLTQRVALAGASEEKRVAIEQESLEWMVQCAHCGFEISVWDLGGVRYRARGTKRFVRRCPDCRHFGRHVVYRAEPIERHARPVVPPPPMLQQPVRQQPVRQQPVRSRRKRRVRDVGGMPFWLIALLGSGVASALDVPGLAFPLLLVFGVFIARRLR